MKEMLKKYNFEEKLFEQLKNTFISGKFSVKDNVLKDKVTPPEENCFIDLKNLDEHQKKNYRLAGEGVIKKNELGYVIVNGGMSTRFGSVVKGISEVFNNKSFIQIKLEQVNKIDKKYGVSTEIFVMNSFATEKASIEFMEQNKYFGLNREKVHFFNQFIFKRIKPNGEYFVSKDNPIHNYYGPGHGDFIFAFKKSGLLEKFIKSGGRHLWYSNVDNLGATIDETLLGLHSAKNSEMTVEIAKKYPGDKGGVPALVNNKIQLVEEFRMPPGFDHEKIRVFNTATYIFNAKSLDKDIKLPWYVVKKKVQDNDVIQFERLTGDLSEYLKCLYLIIDREERFFPIKTAEDLQNLKDKLKKRFA